MLSALFVLVLSKVPPEAAEYHLYTSPETAPDAINVVPVGDPIQILASVVPGVGEFALIVKFDPLSVLVSVGVELTTRIL